MREERHSFHPAMLASRRHYIRDAALSEWSGMELGDARQDFTGYLSTLTEQERLVLRTALVEERVHGQMYAGTDESFPEIGLCGCVLGTVFLTRTREEEVGVDPDSEHIVEAVEALGWREGNSASPLETLAHGIEPQFSKWLSGDGKADERTALFLKWMDEYEKAPA